MPFIFKRLALFLSISAAFAADKDLTFRAQPVNSYAHHQTNSQVTIAVQPYTTEDQQKEPFGKLDLYRLGILPVLVVIQNDSGQAIRLDAMKAEYVGPNGSRA